MEYSLEDGRLEAVRMRRWIDLPPVLFRELVAIRVLQLLQHAAVEGQAAVDL